MEEIHVNILSDFVARKHYLSILKEEIQKFRFDRRKINL